MEKAPAKLIFEYVKTEYYPEWGFRPGVPMYPMKMNFIFLNGGMGDYICWMRSIQWLMEKCTWIHGTLIAPDYFAEFANYWMKDFPNWRYMLYHKTKENPEVDQTPYRGPLDLQTQALNATGAHLLTCGWVYFTNKEKAPVGWDDYPSFKSTDLMKVPLPATARILEGKRFVIMITGTTTPSRTIPGKYWNPIIEYVREKGLIPVFLGKAKTITGNPRNIHTKWDSEIRFDLGVDMREQTTLMQAASLMNYAKLVIGHDSGLLHLAGCTDTPIVFGYNIAAPEHRKPRRKSGKVYDVFVPESELACTFCQSRTNFVIGYNFQKCFYGDTKCIDMLFADSGARWKRQIDLALEESFTQSAFDTKLLDQVPHGLEV